MRRLHNLPVEPEKSAAIAGLRYGGQISARYEPAFANPLAGDSTRLDEGVDLSGSGGAPAGGWLRCAGAQAIPVSRGLQEHLVLTGMPREKVLATVIRILDATAMRVGKQERNQA
jgi:hypothetical protein